MKEEEKGEEEEEEEKEEEIKTHTLLKQQVMMTANLNPISAKQEW